MEEKARGPTEKPSFAQKCKNGCTDFGNFLYKKSDKGETLVMGRTGNSWAKIGAFYFVFYGFLAGFFIGMLAIFLTTINKPEDGGGPKLTQFIKNQPGLTRLDQDKGNRIPNPIVRNSTASDNYAKFVNDFLKASYSNSSSNTGIKCARNNTKGIPDGEKPCLYDYMTELGECSNSKNNNFGLNDGKPCLFVKINKVYGWVPEVAGEYLTLSCDQGTPYPKGFLLAAFPFRGQKDFQLPVVAVQVDLTKDSRKTVICKLEGKGIDVSDSVVPSRAFGKIRFEDVTLSK